MPPRSGIALLDGDVDHHAAIGSDDALIGFLRFERELEQAEERKAAAKEEKRKMLELVQFESCADDVPIDLETMQHFTEEEARAYFESGGLEMPARLQRRQPPPPQQPEPTAAPAAAAGASRPEYYQMDMFGVKRGACQTKKGGGCKCVRFTPRVGLYKTEGLGGIAIAGCQTCGHENLDHEHLGQWKEGEPQLVDETGRWKWIMSVEGGGAATSKKVRMDD